MKLHRVLVYWLLLAGTALYAQDTPYVPLRSQAPLPEFLTKAPSEKYRQRLREQNLTAGRDTDTEDRTDFYLQTTYLFDEVLRSGYVLYNDPVGKYLNDVLAKILAANPAIPAEKPRVFVLKSTEVNAFAIDQGIIFVSLGLLAQLEDESQLALILAHELAHVTEAHSLDGFLEAARIDRENVKGNKNNTQEFDLATLSKNNYSREQELEADEIGTTYFLRTDYRRSTIVRVFDILRYAHLPFDEIAFPYSTLEKGNVQLPEKVYLEEVKPIAPPEEIDEEDSSHPALDKRIEQLNTRLAAEGGNTDGQRPAYLVSEERFQNARRRAREALPSLYLEDQLLSEAIYAAFLLDQTYGMQTYAQEMIGKGLYGWAKFKGNGQTLDVSSRRWPHIEGESQRLFHIINKLNSDQITILAIAYNYDLYRLQPDDTALRTLLVDLFGELYTEHDITSLDYFVKVNVPTPQPIAPSSTTDEEPGKLNKLDKINRSLPEQSENLDWEVTAFSDYLTDTLFLAVAEEGFAYGKDRQGESDYYSSHTKEGREHQRDFERRKKRKGVALGIDKVVLLSPTYLYISSRNPKGLDYQQSEEEQLLLQATMLDLASEFNLQVITLDANTLRADDDEILNDHALASNWISTQLDAENFIYHGYDKASIDDFAERYDTRFLLSAIVVSTPLNGLFGRVFSPGESLLLVFVFDLETGRRSYLKSDYLRYHMSETFLKSQLYDALFQLTQKG